VKPNNWTVDPPIFLYLFIFKKPGKHGTPQLDTPKKKMVFSIVKEDQVSVFNPFLENLNAESYVPIHNFYKDEYGINNRLRVTWCVPTTYNLKNVQLVTYATDGVEKKKAEVPFQPVGTRSGDPTFSRDGDRVTVEFRINQVSRSYRCFDGAVTKFIVRLEEQLLVTEPISEFSSSFEVFSKRKIPRSHRKNTTSPRPKKRRRPVARLPEFAKTAPPMTGQVNETMLECHEDIVRSFAEVVQVMSHMINRIKTLEDNLRESKVDFDRDLENRTRYLESMIFAGTMVDPKEQEKVENTCENT